MRIQTLYLFIGILITFIIFVKITITWYKLIKDNKINVRDPILKDLVIFLMICTLFSLISYDVYVMKSPPSLPMAISSICFLSVLFLYSAYRGIKPHTNFLLFLVTFWVTGAFAVIFGYYSLLAFIFVPADFLVSVPLIGGLSYLLNISPSLGTSLASVTLSFSSCYIGYQFGEILKPNVD